MLRRIAPTVGGSAPPVRRGRQSDVTVSVNNVSANHTWVCAGRRGLPTPNSGVSPGCVGRRPEPEKPADGRTPVGALGQFRVGSGALQRRHRLLQLLRGDRGIRIGVEDERLAHDELDIAPEGAR